MAGKSSQTSLDHHDYTIMRELQADARLSMAELSRRVSLSQPAIRERVKKLEEANIIKGYHAVLDAESLGYTIRAVVRIVGQTPKINIIMRLIDECPEIIRAYNVTGEDSWVMEIAVSDVRHLDQVVSKFSDIAETSTSIILREIKAQAGVKPLML